MKNYKTYYKRNLPHYQPPGYTFFVTYRLDGSLPVEVIKRLKEEKEKALKVIAGYDDIKVRKEKYKTYQSQYFGKFDRLLDSSGFGPVWLKEDKVAQIVKEAIHFYDKKTYDLICYTIMPNHVHQIFTPIVGRISDSTTNKLEENNTYSHNQNNSIIKDTTSKSDDNYFRNGVSDYHLYNTVTKGDVEYFRNGVSNYIVTKILQDLKKFTAGKCNKILNRSGVFWQHESYDHVVRDEKELRRIVEYVLNNPVKAGLCEKWEDWKWSYCNFDLLG